MRTKLTDKVVSNLKANGSRYEVWDAVRPAFGVRVGSSGKKSWVYLYHWEGRARRLTLGQYPRLSLADAGLAFANAYKQLEHGIDPGASEVEKRRQFRTTPTVRELGCEYIEKHCKPNKRSWESDERIFNHDVLAAWGSRKITSIRRADVNDLLDDVAARAPIQSNRTFAFVRAMFRFAESRDYIPASPCHGVRARARERSRDRVLEMQEVSAVWHGIDQPGITQTVRLGIRLLILTGQRIGEVVNAEWHEIDLDKAVWTQPGEKVKNGKPHRVPLSPQAVMVLRRAQAVTDEILARRIRRHAKSKCGQSREGEVTRWVFPSPRGDKPITSQSIDRALRRLRGNYAFPDFRPHDLRRTAASHMTRLGIERLTVHKLLNHSDRGVTAIYDRYDYDEPKRKAVNVWGVEVEKIVSPRLIELVEIPSSISASNTPGVPKSSLLEL